MGYPYYKRYPRDFFEGTMGMPFEVKAAYGLLLDLIFIRDGRLPDDARFIAGTLGLSVRKWNLIRETLLTWPNADGTTGKIGIAGGEVFAPDLAKWMRGEGREHISAAKRLLVFDRDGYACVYCADAIGPFHLDHVVPVSRGGSDEVVNLACACKRCNLSKGAKLLSEWLGSAP